MKKNLFLSICAAGLLIFSFPDFNFFFLIWVALVPFFFLLDGKSLKAAFFWGWWTGYLFFLGTHYWLIHVTLPGMLLVNLYLGVYFGIFGLGYAFFQKLPFKYQLWVFPSLWVVCELMRDRLFTGFGWACLGHSQYRVLPVIQIADMTGVFGVSFFIVIVNVLIKGYARFCKRFLFEKKGETYKVFVFVVIGVIGILGYGYLKIFAYRAGNGLKISVAVIQPNVSQSRKWEPASWDEIQKGILYLTQQAGKQKPDLFIWPETSFPGYLWQSPKRYEQIKSFVAHQQIPLLLGAVTMQNAEYYNSAILLSQQGEESAHYHKMHLVPFGEFLPLRPYLNFIENFVPIGDFSRGKERTVFPQGFSTLICFEDTVAPVVRALTQNKAQFLVNITNDGWFKKTNAPVLHLQASVLQAVANRRPIVRAANTGVSGFISSTGKMDVLYDENGKAVMVQGFLVREVYGEKRFSFYTRFGDVFSCLCFFVVGVAAIKRKFCL